MFVDSVQFASLTEGDEVLTYTNTLGNIVAAHQDAPVDTNPYQNPDYPVDAIVVCLDRNYGDCDYSMNYDRVVRFPLKREVDSRRRSVGNPHSCPSPCPCPCPELTVMGTDLGPACHHR